MPLRHEMTLEKLNSRSGDNLPGWFSMKVVEVREGSLTMEYAIRPQYLAPNGFLHAATVVALADTACGYGCIAHLPKGAENFTTVELKTNFLGTARDGTLACVARPAHLGKTTQVWDAVVSRHADGKAIALFRCTQVTRGPEG